MKTVHRCIACGVSFEPRPQNRNQRYCSMPACQRERRRQWQRARLCNDPDYRENQKHAQSNWRLRHQDYWQQYRASHPAYCERNRAMQRIRNAMRCSGSIAKVDASPPYQPLASGFYILRRAAETDDAKMNSCTVHIAVLSAPRAGAG
ncbi:hypothetical protein SAMN02787142_3257 [Burkholderia sp. WP9]|nr:hypothetical protein [Burkholderia sp. WP9]SED48761.1 hypothetical protein SAMN02787142_3257 [Burkholderia sp. WP9]